MVPHRFLRHAGRRRGCGWPVLRVRMRHYDTAEARRQPSLPHPMRDTLWAHDWMGGARGLPHAQSLRQSRSQEAGSFVLCPWTGPATGRREKFLSECSCRIEVFAV